MLGKKPFSAMTPWQILGLEVRESHEFERNTDIQNQAVSNTDNNCNPALPEKEWCSHVGGDERWYRASIMTHWKYCPICSAPRPPKKKTLAEVLRNDALQCRWQWDQINGISVSFSGDC